jgi:integrase/recombinase XerD
VIEPYTKEQIQDLLSSTSHSAPWERLPETPTELPRQRQLRDKAMILFLLDTGVRASELCSLDIGDVDLSAGHAIVQSKGRLNSGEGKGRPIRVSPTTIKALHRYLVERNVLDEQHADRPLFATRDGRRFERRYLAKHLRRLGRRAGVLRNGGDIYTLQDLLGHTSLDMVRRYLHLAQVDIDSAHRRASPVENWRL